MYITKDDLDFLIELENQLGSEEGWSDRVFRLWQLIEKLSANRDKVNKRIANYVKEKRKIDKNYARSKK